LRWTVERLHGSWVLVRMKQDRTGGKRTNWLLIKHRDASARSDGGAAAAGGRPLGFLRAVRCSEIAAGKGRAPTPFMLSSGKGARADAVWRSKESARAAPRPAQRAQKLAKAARAPERRAGFPTSWSRSLTRLVEQPPNESGWAHEVKFDGYRLQLARRRRRRHAQDAQLGSTGRRVSPRSRPRQPTYPTV
jgi:bifunctional non-homologous end joining protein LigD